MKKDDENKKNIPVADSEIGLMVTAAVFVITSIKKSFATIPAGIPIEGFTPVATAPAATNEIAILCYRHASPCACCHIPYKADIKPCCGYCSAWQSNCRRFKLSTPSNSNSTCPCNGNP